MIGDFFYGYRSQIRGGSVLDRLLVLANDLDVPPVLPPGNSVLTLTEPGPVGIYRTSVTSVQQLQQLLRTGSPIPPATVVGTIADSATMTTAITVNQIQALLASTPGLGYDIVPLAAPPGTYFTAVDGVFQSSYGGVGTTSYDGPGSGAMLQNGADTLVGGEDFDAFYYYSYAVAVDLPGPGTGLGPVGRLKVAEGNSPLPQDRVYFRYGYFDAVPIGGGGYGLDRFIPGFERTFLDGMFSLEMRFPFAATVDSNMMSGSGGMTNTNHVEFGNIAAYLKALLYATDRLAVSGGMGITIPTADDLHVRLADGSELVQLKSDAVYLQPFVAGLYTPNDRWFAHGFLQMDIDANGNPVQINSGNGLSDAGRLNDATFLFADVGLGYWLHRSNAALLTGIAPTVELHYNTSLQNGDRVSAGPFTVGNLGDHVDALNLTVGSTFAFGESTNLTIGYIAPIANGADQQLDGGFRVLLDYYPSPRL